jgi:hypothetical protein
MIYNFKRAVGFAVLLYIATFIVGIVAGVASGQDMSSINTVSDSFWYVGMVAAVVLTTLFTIWYLKRHKVGASAKSGFLFGLTAVVVSSVLDFIFFSLGNAGGAHVDLGQYYGDYRFWIIIVLVVLTASAIGARKAAGPIRI